MRESWRKINLLLLILTPLFIAGLFSSWIRRAGLLKNLEDLREEKLRLTRENEDLRSFLQYFSLKANLEREARSSLNLAKRGETLVIFVSPTTSPPPTTAEEELNFLDKILRWFRR